MKGFAVILYILILAFGNTSPQRRGKYTNLNFKPRFDQNYSPLTLTVDENTNAGFVLADISIYAKDDEGDELHYDIDAVGSHICTIGKDNGKLMLKVKPDRELTRMYRFKVLVSDNFEGGINREASLDVYLYIRDENDNKPVFQETPYHAEILEDADVGVEVFTVYATDADAGPNKEIRYMFPNDKPHEMFNLDPDTGVITLKKSLNYEHRIRYTLDIIAKDEGSPALTEKTRVVVDVRDVGDNEPYFVLHAYEEDIKENLQRGTQIAIVKAKDGDKSINNEINYSIVAGDEYGLFYIDKKTGNITVNGELDRESYTEFQLRIKAYEKQQPTSFKTVNFKIKLLDENDNKPKFEHKSYFLKLPENKVNAGTVISKDIKAVDEDTTWRNNVLVYGIEENDYFEILPESGTLLLKEDLRLPLQEVYSFFVYATERETRDHFTAKTNVTVQVVRTPIVIPFSDGRKSSSSIYASQTHLLLLMLMFATYAIMKLS